ncbi:hypothetical protein [Limibacterium fermenti]|uniref:hypothetical protein n=1 Tax=Limibacterium fermenti TaxID=3229863 RepID=UPI003A65D6C4
MGKVRPEDIQRQIADALSAFGKSLSGIENKMLQEIEMLIKELDVDRNGKIKTTSGNIKKVTLISKKLEKIVLNKEYVKDTATFLQSFRRNSALQDGMYGQKRTEGVRETERLSIEMVADNLTESGVKANIVNPVKRMLVENITTGGSYSDLTARLREMLTPADGSGIVTKYVKTYALDSLNSFSANYNSIISKDRGYEWFVYTGSLLETSREFCKLMVKKKYFHVSEIPELLKGHIGGHQCELSGKTGLPKGMKEETTEENFHQLRGGWNCGHQITGIPEGQVPKALRDKVAYAQKEGVNVSGNDKHGFGTLNFDPTGIKTFIDLTTHLSKKVSSKIKKEGLETYLGNNAHETFDYGKGKIYTMEGSEYNPAEFHIAEKLEKAGNHVIFPNQGDLGKGRKSDIWIYDAKTYYQRQVEMKSLFGNSYETVSKQLSSGSGQSSIVAYDIQSGIKKNWLIKGLREGWSKNTRAVLLNWKGQWYELSKKKIFSDEIHRLLP